MDIQDLNDQFIKAGLPPVNTGNRAQRRKQAKYVQKLIKTTVKETNNEYK